MEEKTLINLEDLSIEINPVMDDLGCAPSFCPYRNMGDLWQIALKKVTMIAYRGELAPCRRPQTCPRCFRENTELSIH